MTTRLWIDVEDIFVYAAGNSRISGIQRVVHEICLALHTEFGESGQVNFVRHDPSERLFRVVPWSAIAAVFEALAQAPPAPAPPAPEQQPATTARFVTPGSRRYRNLRQLVYRLPPEVRQALIRFALAELAALSALADLVRPRPSQAIPPAAPPATAAALPLESSPDPTFISMVAPGDVLLAVGAPWSVADHPGRVAQARDRFGLRFALLAHDIIPLRRPEWCDRALTAGFATWLDRVLPLCDTIFTVSRATAEELRRHADASCVPLTAPIVTVPIGSGFNVGADGASRDAVAPAGGYALVVSTIEPRKNHALLFHVWRRLLTDLPRDRVPTLVFAGRIGWLAGDLLAQLRNADFLGGKIVIVENPSDRDLQRLYRDCLFTLLPSFYEGWGLPVTESLAMGKPCLVADIAALREAGGALVQSFDPENGTEAYRVIRETIEDRAGLQRWQERVVREFRPISWQQTAAVLLDALRIAPALAAAPAQ